jgi:hypothetical protein
MALVQQARRLAADYRGSPLQAHREVSDVLSKLAAENDRLRAERDEAHRALWCVTQQHGGRLSIGQRAFMDHRPGASNLTVTTSADGLSLEIRAD